MWIYPFSHLTCSYQSATVDVLITLAVNSSYTYAYDIVITDLYALLLVAFQNVQIFAAALHIQRFGKILYTTVEFVILQ